MVAIYKEKDREVWFVGIQKEVDGETVYGLYQDDELKLTVTPEELEANYVKIR